MASYEALYRRQCCSPVGWFEYEEARLLGTDLVCDALENVKLIQERLCTVRFRKKSYADMKARDVAFMVLERVGEVAYRLTLLPSLLGVHMVFYDSMLLKYYEDPSHMLDFSSVQLDKDLSYAEELMAILDRQVRKLRSKNIASVKVQGRGQRIEEETWETEHNIRSRYPHFLAL
ncbi:uncharacterized protein [Nicotiana tomentosiformis]|uniref:uncharacterized protein n=1 Tax=Nicotiana tomentosiformis TaxID=4098 RepID=UPI00388C72DD